MDERLSVSAMVARDLTIYIRHVEKLAHVDVLERRVLCARKPELLRFLAECGRFPTFTPCPEIVRPSEVMTAVAAGAMLNPPVGGRRVRQLLADGQLVGELTPSGWLVSRASVEALQRKRAA